MAAAAGCALVAELALGCASPRSTVATTTTAPPPAADIYTAVLGKHFSPTPGRRLHIVAAPCLPPDWVGALDHPLWPALVEATSRGLLIPDPLPVPLPYEMLSESQLDAARQDPSLRIPDGDRLVSFSGIGYDPSGQRALVYIEWHCGGECGGGGFYELERQGQVWRTVQYFHRFDI
jgi:hypothetical protein